MSRDKRKRWVLWYIYKPLDSPPSAPPKRLVIALPDVFGQGSYDRSACVYWDGDKFVLHRPGRNPLAFGDEDSAVMALHMTAS